MQKKGSAFLLVALAALVLTAASGAKQSATVLNGAGSTFVQPLVSTWTPALGSAYDFTIQYSGIGSGGGIQAITNRSVDFGASDAPLTTDQFTACGGCVQIPWALAGTAMAYNIPGITPASTAVHIHLSGEVIVKLYSGQITNWNDPQIKALNPGATFPNLKVTPVYRTGNSGTTYNFTDFLSSVSSAWQTNIGVGQSVNWPAGVGASGSAGVAGVVAGTPGAICYVDTAFALANHLAFAAVENSAGHFPLPNIKNVAAAGAAIKKVPASNELHIVNPSKAYPTAYPISTYTYIIVPLAPSHGAALRKMIYWALTSGQKGQYTSKLLFAPIPLVVLNASEKTMTRIAKT